MTGIQRLNRALLSTLTKTPEAAHIIADRLEELEREAEVIRGAFRQLRDITKRAKPSRQGGTAEPNRYTITVEDYEALVALAGEDNDETDAPQGRVE